MDLTKVPELRKELEFITNHPEHWNQRTWWEETMCGSVGCLAGNAVFHSPLYSIVRQQPVSVATGRREDWVLAGMDILGLTIEEAEWIFSGGNDLPTLWYLANKFSNGEIEIPARFQE